MSLRIVFMGTPDFAVPTLAALSDAGHDVIAVYTQPPRPAGRRGLEPTPSPVQREAERRGLMVRTPASLRGPAEQAELAALDADVAVVVAYGLILPGPVLEAPRFGCYNGHASLLPRWRGAAPIQRAIMAGDTETGMMIMKMDAGLDTGPVVLDARIPIGRDETAGDLHDRLAALGATLMTEAMARLEEKTLHPVPQPAKGVTYAAKISKEETRIDWTKPAGEVHDRIRGLSPFPGAWSEWQAGARIEAARTEGLGGERVKLLRTTVADGDAAPGSLVGDAPVVGCGTGAIRLVSVQRAGGRPVSGEDFLRGLSAARDGSFA